jgi:hypothetical protein
VILPVAPDSWPALLSRQPNAELMAPHPAGSKRRLLRLLIMMVCGKDFSGVCQRNFNFVVEPVLGFTRAQIVRRQCKIDAAKGFLVIEDNGRRL